MCGAKSIVLTMFSVGAVYVLETPKSRLIDQILGFVFIFTFFFGWH